MEIKDSGGSDKEFPSPSTQNNSEPLILPDLPFEVIIEILLRLPVKSLLKFKCVSKSWLSLISSPQFIKRQFSCFSTSENKQKLLIVGWDERNSYLKHCSLTSLLYDDQPTDIVEVDYLPMERLSRYLIILGCCNGLVCIEFMSIDVLLWNPATRKSKMLPRFISQLDLEDYYITYSFGYDEMNDDYKVVAVVCSLDEDYNPSASDVMVYSVKTESWRNIGEFQGGFPKFGYLGRSFVNGKLHWALEKADCKSVVFLDLATETFGSLDLVETHGGAMTMVYDFFRPELTTFGGSLCLLCRSYRNSFTDVWVMKEYGVTKSWIKLLTISIDDHLTNFFRPFYIPGNDSRFLGVLRNELRLYDSKDGSFRLLPSPVNSRVAGVYVESLVSPNSIDAPERQ
ncbi:hypothetical protein ACH5RR_031639 [Cinchona calisaya]|uniref:F-box domain-containing protein n=1 Tax=Cinchona calisaya TaxID=153742 RepID=A0ABD2YIU4_9GENT